MNRFLTPPLQLFETLWRLLWSPATVVLALLVWWYQGFPRPSWPVEGIPPVCLHGALVVGAGLAVLRWFWHRPRVEVVYQDRIVYRDRPEVR